MSGLWIVGVVVLVVLFVASVAVRVWLDQVRGN